MNQLFQSYRCTLFLLARLDGRSASLFVIFHISRKVARHKAEDEEVKGAYQSQIDPTVTKTSEILDITSLGGFQYPRKPRDVGSRVCAIPPRFSPFQSLWIGQ